MEIPEKDYDEFEGRLKELSYATDYIQAYGNQQEKRCKEVRMDSVQRKIL